MLVHDGRNGRTAFINKDNQLAVAAKTVDGQLVAIEKGRGFNFNSGELDLTSSSESVLLYFLNNEPSEVVIDALALGMDDLGTHVGKPVVTIIRNPTAPSVTTDADIICNRAFNSSLSPAAATLVYKGAEAATVTGTEACLLLHANVGARLFATINLVLGVGDSIAIKINPKVTAGTCKVYAALIVYAKEDIT